MWCKLLATPFLSPAILPTITTHHMSSQVPSQLSPLNCPSPCPADTSNFPFLPRALDLFLCPFPFPFDLALFPVSFPFHFDKALPLGWFSGLASGSEH